MKQGKRWAIVAAGCAVLFAGCKGAEHQEAVAKLERAEQAMREAAAAYAALPQDSLDAVRIWATTQLRDFELLAADSGVVLTRDEGAIVADVSRVRRLLKDNPDRVVRLRASQEQAAGQIHLLIEALQTGATTDGAGTTIDSAYVRRQVTAELRTAEAVAASWQETTDYGRRGLKLAAATRLRSDSLGEALRQRLAKWVLEHGAP